AGDSRQEPPAGQIKDVASNGDVGQGAETAEQHEGSEAAYRLPADEAAIAVGQHIVQKEVRDHRDGGRDRLAKGEVRADEQREAPERQVAESGARPERTGQDHAKRYLAAATVPGE